VRSPYTDARGGGAKGSFFLILGMFVGARLPMLMLHLFRCCAALSVALRLD